MHTYSQVMVRWFVRDEMRIHFENPASNEFSFFPFHFLPPEKKNYISMYIYTRKSQWSDFFNCEITFNFLLLFLQMNECVWISRAKAESFEQIIKKAKENKIIVSIPLEPFIAYMRFKLFLHRSIPTSDCDLTTMTTTRSLWSVTKDLLW